MIFILPRGLSVSDDSDGLPSASSTSASVMLFLAFLKSSSLIFLLPLHAGRTRQTTARATTRTERRCHMASPFEAGKRAPLTRTRMDIHRQTAEVSLIERKIQGLFGQPGKDGLEV